jgi:Ca2+-binding RTX toxin-like protein
MDVQKNLRRSLALAAVATLATGLTGALPADASPAPAAVTVSGGTLSITGTNGDDSITVDFGNPDSVGVDLDGTRQDVARRTFTSISVSLRSGADRFTAVSGGSALTDEPLVVGGSAGRDTILGGAGNDALFGADGDDNLRGGAGTDVLIGDRGADFVDGGVGTDTEVLGSGDDVAAWVPGEGNDVVDGGSGRDTLAFDGGAGDDVMSLSANGHAAVFLRSPGSIRMDLTEVERIDVRAFAGADTVTLDDAIATDVEETTIDLGVAGAADTKTDSVTVNGTERADDVSVDARDGVVSVSGLRPETLISGSDARDVLNVNTLGGPDQVHVTNAATSLIGILVDFGAGQ